MVHHVAGGAAEWVELRRRRWGARVRKTRVVMVMVVRVVVVVALGGGGGSHGRWRRVGDGGRTAANRRAGHEVLRSDIADVGPRG